MKQAAQLLIVASISCVLFARSPLQAQSGGFVVMLGKDTVQVEQFTRSATRVEGTVVTRSPRTRVVHYRLDLGANGAPTHYEQNMFDATAAKIEPSPANAVMTFTADSVFIDTWKAADPANVRLAIPNGAMPLIGSSLAVPFANSYMTYELAYQQARRDANASGESKWSLVSSLASQKAPQNQRVWLFGADSLEADYFGIARSGFHFDRNGRLDRTNWTQTTYRYLGHRVATIDVERIAKAWGAADNAGTGFGVYSPHDSATTKMGAASIWLDYGRPSARGRRIWTDVVVPDVVWRLGADFATQLKTDVALTIGGIDVPAGKYSLWMMPSETAPQLIINKQSGQFGTQYDPRQDLARVPLRKADLPTSVEKLTLSVHDDALWIVWGDRSYSVVVKSQ